MQMLKCDVCGTIMSQYDGSHVKFETNCMRREWKASSGKLGEFFISTEHYDLCNRCSVLTLRKVFGDDLTVKGEST